MPIETDQAKKRGGGTFYELNSVTVFSILKMVTSSQDLSHPPNIFPVKDNKSLNQERKSFSDQ